MKASAVLLILVMGGTDVAAATLKGFVLADEIGGRPLANVQIRATGASPTASLFDGSFFLIFPTRQPGDAVELEVQKRGYVVVNDIQRKLQLPAIPDAQPVVLLLCKSADREEMALRFYRLKSLEAIATTYRKRVAELQEKNQASTAALALLRKERDQARAAAEDIAKQLAKLAPGTATGLYENAMLLFLAGKSEEALNVLDEAKLLELVRLAHKHETEAARGYLLKAQIQTTLFRFDEAERIYTAALAAAPNSLDTNFAIAEFRAALNRYPQAVSSYAHALQLAEQSHDRDAIAAALYNLGILYRETDRMSDARASLDAALTIARELSQQDPLVYLPKVADTLVALGALNHKQNRLDEAYRYHTEAVSILRTLQQRAAQAPRRELALALNSLAAVEGDLNYVDEAGKHLEEARAILRDFVRYSRETYLPTLADIQNNLGILRGRQLRLNDAQTDVGQAWMAYRDLANQNPETYLPKLATTSINRATVYSQQSQAADAINCYDEALQIFRDLASRYPDAYLSWVAKTLQAVGILYAKKNRMDEADAAYAEALGILLQLQRSNRPVYRPQVAVLLNEISILYQGEHLADDARDINHEALAILRELTTEDPKVYQADLAMALNSFGSLESERNHLEEADNAFTEALVIRRQLEGQDQEIYLPAVAESLNNLGQLRGRQGRLSDATTMLEEALSIYRRLAQKQSTYRDHVAFTLANLGTVDALQNHWPQAEKHYEAARQIRRDLALSNPEAYFDEYGNALAQLTEFYGRSGRLDKICAIEEDALRFLWQMDARYPGRYLLHIVEMLDRLALLYERLRRWDAARQVLQEALCILRTVSTGGTHKDESERYLRAEVLDKLGLLYERDRHFGDSAKAFAEELEVCHELAVQNGPKYWGNLAFGLYRLGHFYWVRYQAPEAMSLYREALELYEEHDKGDAKCCKEAIAGVKRLMADIQQRGDRP